MSENENALDQVQIQGLLKHRYPFILVDKVIGMELGKSITAIKNVTINEPFFQGHFPGRPVMPGVLILEAIAQSAAILSYKSQSAVASGSYIMIVGANSVKWKRMVVPGDVLRIEVKLLKKKGPLWIVLGEVYVEDKIAAVAELSAMEVQ